MTRMLCRPSCPKWYIWGIPAARRTRASGAERHRESQSGGTDIGRGGRVLTTACEDAVRAALIAQLGCFCLARFLRDTGA